MTCYMNQIAMEKKKMHSLYKNLVTELNWILNQGRLKNEIRGLLLIHANKSNQNILHYQYVYKYKNLHKNVVLH